MKSFADYGIELTPGAGSYGGEVRALCPECSPNRKPGHQHEKDLAINLDKGTWTCHHCSWSGSLEGKNGNLPNGAPLLRREKKPVVRPRPLQPMTLASDPEAKAWAAAKAWFAKRGILEETLIANKVDVGLQQMPQFDHPIYAIRYPYFLNGEHINTKYRSPDKQFSMEKGAERAFYGLDNCVGAQTITIVEGENDKLACWQAGITRCLSVPDGAPAVESNNYASKFAFLESGMAILETAREVIIAVDNDGPGKKLADELIRRIGGEKCYRVHWPEGCKDANDALMHLGVDGLLDCLGGAVPEPVDGIIRITDLYDALDDLYDHGLPGGLSTGIPDLDKHFTWVTKTVTTFSGSPGAGKSTLIDFLAVNSAKLHGWRWAIFSPENRPLQRHAAMLTQQYVGAPFKDGQMMRMTRAQMHEARAWLADRFFLVSPEDPTLDGILRAMKATVFREGVKGVVIDPWNRIAHKRPPGKTETEYIGECLTLLLRFAQIHDVATCIVAHPTKQVPMEDGEYREVLPWDLSGSANWFNMSDQIISVRRLRKPNNKDKPVEIHVQKIRFAETGEEGVVLLNHDRATGRYAAVRKD